MSSKISLNENGQPNTSTTRREQPTRDTKLIEAERIKLVRRMFAGARTALASTVEYAGSKLPIQPRQLTAGAVAVAVAFGSSAAFGAEGLQAEKRSHKSAITVGKANTLTTLAETKITSLGARIIKLVQGQSSPAKNPKPLSNGLEEFQRIVDFDGPTGQAFPDEYSMSVILARTKDNKVHNQNIDDVYIYEGVQHQFPYARLEFVKNTNNDGWGVMGSYLQSNDPYTTNLPKTIRASTTRNLFGVPQPRITGGELEAIVDQGSQEVTNAMNNTPTGLLPFAFSPPAGESLNTF